MNEEPKIGDYLTAKFDVVSIAGNTILEKGQKAPILEIEYSADFFGRMSGVYHKKKIAWIKLVGIRGQWLPETFIELSPNN